MAPSRSSTCRPAGDTFWGGYAGYFQDPDEHLWEVVWNPQWADLASEWSGNP